MRSHCGHITGLRIALTDHGDDGVAWRLLAGNGRSLGRSAILSPNRSASIAALAELCGRAESLVPYFTHTHNSVSWAWTAVDRTGVVLALGERSYGRYGTCLAASKRFLATARALSADGVWALDAEVPARSVGFAPGSRPRSNPVIRADQL